MHWKRLTALMFASTLLAESAIMAAIVGLDAAPMASAASAWSDSLVLGALVFGCFLFWCWTQAGHDAASSRTLLANAAVVGIAATAFEYALHPLSQIIEPAAGETAAAAINALAAAAVVAAVTAWVTSVDASINALLKADSTILADNRRSMAISALVCAVCAIAAPILYNVTNELDDARSQNAAEIINLGGRQRMFAEEIGRLALLPSSPETRARIDVVINEAETQWNTLQRLSHTYEQRNRLDTWQRLNAPTSAPLQDTRTAYLDLARLTLDVPRAQRPAIVAALQQAVDDFVPRMDHSVQTIADTESSRSHGTTSLPIFAASSFVFTLMAIGLMWPLLRFANSNMTRLREALAHADAALQDLEAYKSGLDQTSIVAITDSRGTIQFANDKFCQISGYARGELIGQNHRILNSGEHPKDFFVYMWRTIGSGKTWRGEVCNRAKDGGIYWVDTAIVPLMDGQKRPQRYVAIRIDITDRKRAETARRRDLVYDRWISDMQAELATTSELAFSLPQALRGLKLMFSAKEAFVLELPPGAGDVREMASTQTQARGPSSVNLLAPPGLKESIAERLAAAGYETTSDNADAVAIPILAAGEPRGVLGLAVDGLEARDIERGLKPLAAALGELMLSRSDAQLRRRADESEQDARVAEEANAAKSRFLATMSHELRTPLTSIRSYAELIREVADEEGRTDEVRDVDEILNASQHLLTLVNDILDLSKIEAGKMTLCPVEFELADLVQEIAAIVRPMAEQNGNVISIDAPQGVRCFTDKDRLRQCMLNLASNAVKFTSQGLVTLQALREQRNGVEWMCIEVRDTGIGMTNEVLARLFRPFMQAEDTTSRRFGGTGLGLALTKDLMENLGGSVSVESEPGKGSVFRLQAPTRLPVSQLAIESAA